MRREHLERLRPVCPTCGAGGLALGAVAREEQEDVLEGALLCGECHREHPIVDGIPIVVADLRDWAAHQLDAVMRRDDLTPFTVSLLGDAAGPGASLDRERTNLSGYGQEHWGTPSFAELCDAALEQPAGVWADLGCAVGRGTVELARRGAELAVGVDLSFAMLRVAERVRRTGWAEFPLRRVGIVYDTVELEVPDVPAERISFWCCDVGVLPFPDGGLDGALSLNVLDCVASPAGHLTELARVLRPGGRAVLTTPYDWSASATAVEHWLGGHSQRADHQGASPEVLRHVLSQVELEVVDERDGVPWTVYANERSRVHYELHLLRLARA